MIVPFSHMSGFIISGYKPLYPHYFDRDLTFTFENYVKCQLHLDIMPALYQRDLYLYLKAFKFLSGDDSYFAECGQVLRFFYQDTADMLCNVLKKNPNINTRIYVQTRFNRRTGFPSVQVELDSVVSELREILDSGDSSTIIGFGAGIFSKFNLSEISRLVPNENLALASVLLYYTNNEIEPTILEVL